ncbi:MAG: tetratricopeptide repeat protein [Gemmataceae bacterium]
MPPIDEVLTQANRLRDAGDAVQAERLYRQALAAQPNQPRTHNSLGILYAQQKNYPAAEASFRQALKLQPDYAKAFNNLGNVLSELGKLNEAAGAYRQAHEFGYRDPNVHDNLSQIYFRRGDARAAEFHLQKALRSKPDDPDLLRRLGQVLVTLVQFDPAIACFRKVVKLRPEDADAWWRMGDAHSGHGFLDKAIECIREAVRLKPEEVTYHHHLGAAYMTLGDLDAALACFRRGLELDPNHAGVRSSLMFCLCYDPRANPTDVLAEHQRWGEQHAPPPATPPVFANTAEPQRVLRIGYVSPDFRGHPVGRFMQPALTNHDPKRVEVFCYDEFVRPPDPLTTRLQTHVKNWRNTRGLTDEQLIAQIRADGIDVLIDLAGHTASNRLRAFAQKAAPVQATYLGYPNTSAVSAIDYLLTDTVADPPDQPVYLTEEPFRLPNGFCCLLPREDVPPVGPLPAAKNGYLTFGCLHGQSKLNDQVLDLWADVLKAVPTAKLLFARHTMAGEARGRLVRLFGLRGIESDRLQFRQLSAGSAEYWHVYPDFDIHLDPFPWTGHTTSTESLWMGVPVITLRGRTHAGRMVASVLTFAGLPDWVADTPQRYVEIANHWAANIDELARLRAGMREGLKKSKLCDAKGFARQLEDAYRTMWQRWCTTQASAAPRAEVSRPIEQSQVPSAQYIVPDSPRREPTVPRNSSAVPQAGLSTPYSVPRLAPRRDDRRSVDLLASAEQARLGGDWLQAEQLFRQLLAAEPDHVEGWTAFGDACKALGKWADGAAHYRKALDLRPQVPRTWNSLGIVLAKQRKFAEAETAFRRIVELDPEHAKGFNNLGNILSEIGHTDEAVAAYRRAFELGYDDGALHENLANILYRLGQYPEAETHFTLGLRRKPDDPNMLRRLGELLAKRMQLDAAADTMRRLIKLQPGDADLYWRLGNVLTDQGNLHEAAQCYRDALKLQPNNAAFLHHLGTALMMAGRITDATASYRRAMSVMKDNRLSHASLLFVECYDPDLDPAEVFAEHRRWGELYAPAPVTPPWFPNNREPNRRLRLGYFSPDFRGHPVGRFIEPVILRHDAEQFELFCYDEFVRPPDPLTARLQTKVTNWRNTRGRSDEEFAAQIKSDRIDILVDLAGHTNSNRLGVFARKPAPVQMTWLGYPNTTGVPAIDYLITDAIVDPSDQPVLMTERPLRLPDGFCCFMPRDTAPPVSEAPLVRNGFLTFGCLHNQAKLNHRVVELWTEILKALPVAKLLFARHTLTDEAQADLLSQFAARDVGAERLEIRRLKAGGIDHWNVYHDIDIALDPFPWTGHTTACESLWMGVPVITLRGRAHAGRMVASVLAFAGLPDWIAETPRQYVELARQWAGQPDRLAALRAGLRDQMRTSQLCDTAGFTRQLEAAYRDAWRKWCA